MRITDVVITPIAIKDPPLRNVKGVHQPYALRAILEVATDEGLVGLSETYGDAPNLELLRGLAPLLAGHDPFDLNGLDRLVAGYMTGREDAVTHELVGRSSVDKNRATVLSALEVACLDLQAKAAGRPLVDILGGRVRDEVPYSGYLFFKNGRHQPECGYPDDDWDEALDADAIVRQARRMIDEYGFGSLKLKGGVLPPMDEADVVLALRDAFPDLPLRIDPNTAWTVDTSVEVARKLTGVLEYLEDPTPTIAGMAEVARRVDMPLATNMCVTEFAHVPPAVAQGAVQVILSDHHFWGGLRASALLAGICRTFGLGLSMHSNSHLGISLAVMTHVAAATPNLTYACDTHTPWQVEDVIEPGVLRFDAGAVRVPDGPGLGVTLDRDALARLHEQYLTCGIRQRDDVGPMRALVPDWRSDCPRW
jgi:glucarate dehydratase